MTSRAVLSLVCQSLDPRQYEIIVVDNASTDDTKEVVQNLIEGHPQHNIRLLYEAELGLSRARNLGAREAHADIIAYIDDDAAAEENFLSEAHSVFNRIRPRPLAAGGQILPLYEVPKPDWFEDRWETRSMGSSERWLQSGETFSGSNMIFNRQALLDAGAFPVELGMIGNRLLLGEETVAMGRIRDRAAADQVFYYVPSLRVAHSVPAWKMSVKYACRRGFGTGQSLARQEMQKAKKSYFWKGMLELAKGVYTAIVSPFYWFKVRNSKVWGYQYWSRVYQYFGGFSVYAKTRLSVAQES